MESKYVLKNGDVLSFHQEMVPMHTIGGGPSHTWTYVDKGGCSHFWDNGYPTLVWIVDDEYYCSCCNDLQQRGHYQCPVCGDVVVPGKEGPKTIMVSGMRTYKLNGEFITNEEATDIIWWQQVDN